MSEAASDPKAYVERLRSLFRRCDDNPILKPEDVPMPCKAVCNPAAVDFEGEVLLVLRVIEENDHSHLVVARSKDGIGDWQVEREPLLSPKEWYDEWGCEDARVTYLPDRGSFVIAYAGYSRFGAGVCLAETRDFRTAERLGMVIHPYNKDAVVMPRAKDGKYRMLHRPTMAPLEDIWVSESDDLLHWGSPKCVLQESDRPGWQGGKIGAGPVPILLDHGWLMFYHGVERTDEHWMYRTGMAILDRDAPERLIARWPEWVFGPEAPYEFDERGQGIVFPTGLVQRDGHLLMYYGAGDRSVGLATADMALLKKFDEDFRREFQPHEEILKDFYENRASDRA